MKVLAIRGSNLASLAGDFEVDFTREPLASAGVYAITGPTGAGKSTLLDAASLALFHATPRFRAAGESGARIPDVDSESLGQGDPRHILRRGTGKAWAEVDFVGIDGRAWRARWQIHRARGRAEGRLQQASARLVELDADGAEGAAVGRGVREVAAAIEARLGLSFEQFRRAILLAQNEFAGFLRADSRERADLLEALTGTGIYARISRLCHERHRAEREALERLAERLKVDPPLDDEQRAGLEERLQAEREEQTRVGEQHRALEAEVHWHRQLAERQTRLQRLETELQQAQADWEARADERARVRRFEAAEAARPQYQALATLRRERSTHAAREAQLHRALEQAESEHQAAEQARAQAQAEAERRQQARREQEPHIRRARELDQAIRERLSREQEAQAAADSARAQEQGARSRRDEAQAAVRANAATREAWNAWLETQPVFRPLAADVARLERLLEDAQQAAEREQQAAAARAAADANAERVQARLEAVRARLGEQQAAQERAREELEQARSREAACGPEALEHEHGELQQRAPWLERLAEGLEGVARLDERLAADVEEQAAAQEERAGIDRRLQELAGERPAAEARLTAARSALESARRIADQHTEALRRELVAGEPCPVCGATEHPWKERSNREVAQILDTLLAQEQEAAGALEALESEERELRTRAGVLDARLEELAARTESARGEREDRAAVVEEQARRLELDTTEPQALRGQLPRLQAELERRQQALEARRAEYHAARSAREAAERRLHELETGLQAQREQLEQLEREAGPLVQAATAAGHEQALRERESHAARAALAQALGLQERPTADALHELAARWAEGAPLYRAAERAEQERPHLEQRLQEREQALGAAEQQLQQRQHELAAQAQALEERRRERREVLEAADADVFAEELEAAASAAAEALEQARQRSTAAGETALKARHDLQHWEQRRDELERQEAELRASLQAWLGEQHAAIGLDRDDIDGLIALLEAPAQDWQPLRDALHQAQEDLAGRRARIEEARSHLEECRREARSGRDAPAAEAALAASAERLEACRRSVSRLEAELEQDDTRRRQAEQHLQELRAQQAVAEQWGRLNELIGSADGSSFKRYAQQFTLDVLVTWANQQLAGLAPRYRLQRGADSLNILVEDLDMGGELRGVHSLSGGETFLASLALALGLAELSSQRVRVESLFIDEGFGSLDAETLRVAMDALDRLQAQGRKVGVISHVQEMSDRIGVQVRIQPVAPGRSSIRVIG